jgi:hypothetical protein
MPGHGYNRLGMPSLLPKPQIKIDNVAPSPTLVEEDDGIGRLDISPLEITIDIGPDPTKEDLASTGFNPRDGLSIAGESVRPEKPVHVSHFHGYHYGQDHPHSRKSHKKPHRRRPLNNSLDLSLSLLYLPLDVIEMLKLFFH